jgi:hypothetical protein
MNKGDLQAHLSMQKLQVTCRALNSYTSEKHSTCEGISALSIL